MSQQVNLVLDLDADLIDLTNQAKMSLDTAVQVQMLRLMHKIVAAIPPAFPAVAPVTVSKPA